MQTFLDGIGIRLIAASSLVPAVFPGMDIQHGCVLLDESRAVHVGDILHEAGHIALTEPSNRQAFRLAPSGGEELAALAWSYAAAVHLGLDPALVFYPESYHDLGNQLIENFAQQNYIGIPLLQKFGMTLDARKAAERGGTPYPHMLRWLR